jgi:protein associated with RNAse G/E
VDGDVQRTTQTDRDLLRRHHAGHLDLDVRRRRWGEIERLDEDEFAEHQVRFGYPDEVIAQATAASYWLATALGDGTEPFASGFRSWLAQVSET